MHETSTLRGAQEGVWDQPATIGGAQEATRGKRKHPMEPATIGGAKEATRTEPATKRPWVSWQADAGAKRSEEAQHKWPGSCYQTKRW